MQLSRYLYVPYQLVRQPLAAVDRHALSKLPAGNLVRSTYRDALGMADRVMALVLNEPGLATATATTTRRSAPAETGQQEKQTPPPADDTPSVAEKQRRRAFAKKEEQVARANHSPAAMKRDLARMQAVVDAREHAQDD